MQNCPICGGATEIRSGTHELRLGRRLVTIEAELPTCTECGEETMEPETMDQLLRVAAETVRKEQGLLTPAEIRAIRQEYHLSQEAFESILNSGKKTVTRWERGTVVQNGTADRLMRLLRRHPELVDELLLESEEAPALHRKGSPGEYVATDWTEVESSVDRVFHGVFEGAFLTATALRRGSIAVYGASLAHGELNWAPLASGGVLAPSKPINRLHGLQ